LNGIESLFRKGPKDPYAWRLAADFSDLFVFSESARYAIVRAPDAPTSEKFGVVPSILRDLIGRDSGALTEQRLIIGEQSVSDEYLSESFDIFGDYVVANRNSIRSFIELHNQPWIRRRPAFQRGVNTGWVFPMHRLIETKTMKALVSSIGVHEEDLCHVFDVALKYSLYGEVAGSDEYYLAHPMRSEVPFPTMNREDAPLPPIPFRIGPSLIGMIGHLTQDEYTSILHEARGLVRDLKLVGLKPNTIEKETLREFAVRLKLPPRLKDFTRSRDSISGAADVASAIPSLGISPTLAGVAISIASLFWKRTLPRITSRWRWLHWGLEWDIEREARAQ
jgi:hypothetical protein